MAADEPAAVLLTHATTVGAAPLAPLTAILTAVTLIALVSVALLHILELLLLRLITKAANASLEKAGVSFRADAFSASSLSCTNLRLDFQTGPIRTLRVASASYGGNKRLLLRPMRALVQLLCAEMFDSFGSRRANDADFDDATPSLPQETARLPLRISGVQVETRQPDSSPSTSKQRRAAPAVSLARWRWAARILRATEVTVDEVDVRLDGRAALNVGSVRVTCVSQPVMQSKARLPLSVRVHCSRVRAHMYEARASGAHADSALLSVTLGIRDCDVDGKVRSELVLAGVALHAGVTELKVCPALARLAKRARNSRAMQLQEHDAAPKASVVFPCAMSCKLRSLTVSVADEIETTTTTTTTTSFTTSSQSPSPPSSSPPPPPPPPSMSKAIVGMTLSLRPFGFSVGPARGTPDAFAQAPAPAPAHESGGSSASKGRIARSTSDPGQIRRGRASGREEASTTESLMRLAIRNDTAQGNRNGAEPSLVAVPEVPPAKSLPFASLMRRFRPVTRSTRAASQQENHVEDETNKSTVTEARVTFGSITLAHSRDRNAFDLSLASGAVAIMLPQLAVQSSPPHRQRRAQSQTHSTITSSHMSASNGGTVAPSIDVNIRLRALRFSANPSSLVLKKCLCECIDVAKAMRSTHQSSHRTKASATLTRCDVRVQLECGGGVELDVSDGMGENTRWTICSARLSVLVDLPASCTKEPRLRAELRQAALLYPAARMHESRSSLVEAEMCAISSSSDEQEHGDAAPNIGTTAPLPKTSVLEIDGIRARVPNELLRATECIRVLTHLQTLLEMLRVLAENVHESMETPKVADGKSEGMAARSDVKLKLGPGNISIPLSTTAGSSAMSLSWQKGAGSTMATMARLEAVQLLHTTDFSVAGGGATVVLDVSSLSILKGSEDLGAKMLVDVDGDVSFEWDADVQLFALSLRDIGEEMQASGISQPIREVARGCRTLASALRNAPPPSPPPLPAFIPEGEVPPMLLFRVVGRALCTFTCHAGATAFIRASNPCLAIRPSHADTPCKIEMSALSIGVNDSELLATRGACADDQLPCSVSISSLSGDVRECSITFGANVLLDLPDEVDVGAIVGSMQALLRAIHTFHAKRCSKDTGAFEQVGKPKWTMNIRVNAAQSLSIRLATDETNEHLCSKYRDLADLVECGESVFRANNGSDDNDSAYMEWCKHVSELYIRACQARKASRIESHQRDTGWLILDLNSLSCDGTITFFGGTKFDGARKLGTEYSLGAMGVAGERFDQARAFCRLVDPASAAPEAVTFPMLDMRDISLSCSSASAHLLGADEPLLHVAPLTLSEPGRIVLASTLWVDAARIPESPVSSANTPTSAADGYYKHRKVRVGRSNVVELPFVTPGTLPALKVFTKLDVSCDTLVGSYGVGMEPIFFEMSQAFRRLLIKTSPDLFVDGEPSKNDGTPRPNLQWWDLMALKWRGEASIVSRKTFKCTLLNGTSCRLHDSARGVFSIGADAPISPRGDVPCAFSLGWQGSGALRLRLSPMTVLRHPVGDESQVPLARISAATLQLRYQSERPVGLNGGVQAHHLHSATQSMGYVVPHLHTLMGTQKPVDAYDNFRTLAATVWIDAQLFGSSDQHAQIFVGSGTLLPLFAWLRDVVWIVPRHLRGLGSLRKRPQESRICDECPGSPSSRSMPRASLASLMRDIRVSVSAEPLSVVHWPPPGASAVGSARVTVSANSARWFGRFVKSDFNDNSVGGSGRGRTFSQLMSPRSEMPSRARPKSRLVCMSLQLNELSVLIDTWPSDGEDLPLERTLSYMSAESAISSEPSTPSTATHGDGKAIFREQQPLLSPDALDPVLVSGLLKSPLPESHSEFVVLDVKLASLKFGLDEEDEEAQGVAEVAAGNAAIANLDSGSPLHPRVAAAEAAAAAAAAAVPPGWYVTFDAPIARYMDACPSVLWSVASDIAAAFPTKPTTVLPRPRDQHVSVASDAMLNAVDIRENLKDVGATTDDANQGESEHADEGQGLKMLLDAGLLKPVRSQSIENSPDPSATSTAGERDFLRRQASSGSLAVDAEAASIVRDDTHDFTILDDDLAGMPEEDGWRPRFMVHVISPKALVHARRSKAWVSVECASVEVLSEGRRDSITVGSLMMPEPGLVPARSRDDCSAILAVPARSRKELRRVRTAPGGGGLNRSRESSLRVLVEAASVSIADIESTGGPISLVPPTPASLRRVTEGSADFLWEKHRWLESSGNTLSSETRRLVGARVATGLPHTEMRAKIPNFSVHLDSRQLHILLEVGMGIADSFQHPTSRATDMSFEGSGGGAYRSFGVDFTPTGKGAAAAAIDAATAQQRSAASHHTIPWPAPSRFLFHDATCRGALDELMWARRAYTTSRSIRDRVLAAEEVLIQRHDLEKMFSLSVPSASLQPHVARYSSTQARHVVLAESHYRFVYGSSLHRDLTARLARRQRAAPGLHTSNAQDGALAFGDWDDGDLAALESVGERRLSVFVGRTCLRLTARDRSALARLEVNRAQFSQSARYLEATGRREGSLRLKVSRFHVSATGVSTESSSASSSSSSGEKRVVALWDPNSVFGDEPMVHITATLSSPASRSATEPPLDRASDDAVSVSDNASAVPEVPSGGRMHHFDHIEVGLAPLFVQITERLATDLWDYFLPPTDESASSSSSSSSAATAAAAADTESKAGDVERTPKLRRVSSRRGKKDAASEKDANASMHDDEKDVEPPSLLSISYFRFNCLHLRLSYQGKPVSLKDMKLVIDTRSYPNFLGTLRQLLARVRWDVVKSVFRSVAGLQGKKVRDFLEAGAPTGGRISEQSEHSGVSESVTAKRAKWRWFRRGDKSDQK